MQTFTFLGTGTSVGIPMLGCSCPVCISTNPRNNRYRCAVLLRLNGGNLLIDTPPELRLQLLRAATPAIHGVLLTHYHADHLHGLDDLRPIPFLIGGPVPLYCNSDTEVRLRTVFSYAFGPGSELVRQGFVPKLTINRITNAPFEVLGQQVIPIPLEHAHFDVLGFRMGNLAYCTDVKTIPKSSWPLLEDLDVLVLGCLRRKSHPAHLSLDEALDVIDKLRPRQTYLTHISHDLDHDELCRELPAGVLPAHDGLTIEMP
ncbi:MAG: MBL fold metallo-hydrolase [Planctomycetota bacterium]|nr:MBL fold metallo-hydrolase [Planctomycetota bacterium]RLS36968.1 MAG: MBL fold metallo-hydrolase [Planctomycetota bacterium]